MTISRNKKEDVDMDELKKLQKEINGKVIWWKSIEGMLLKAICIWPPKGHQVSIKPFDMTTEEILKVIHWRTPYEVEHPNYCLTASRALSNNPEIKRIAETPDGCVYNPLKYAMRGKGDPYCPYGA